MVELADIFRHHGPAYLDRFGERMLPSHHRALQDIMDCRTETLGGHVYECDHCSTLHFAYHSCRNRSCPKCSAAQRVKWLEKKRKELLPVTYFHLVFTLPKELREIVRTHQKLLYPILMKAAAYSLMKLALDPHFVGAKIGVLALLHTWTRAMIYHVHVHCLVPGGGISADGSRWIASRKNYLVHVGMLSTIFRAKFTQMARKALPAVRFPESVWRVPWVVYSKPALQGSEKALDYLARYLNRIAITNSRILSCGDGQITFRYKDSRDHKWKTMILPAMEFIHRFLQHVLPKGMHKVRSYGLLAPVNRHLLQRAKELLTASHNKLEQTRPDVNTKESAKTEQILCPICKVGHLIRVSSLPRLARGPPCK